jgi:hypothetical protein
MNLKKVNKYINKYWFYKISMLNIDWPFTNINKLILTNFVLIYSCVLFGNIIDPEQESALLSPFTNFTLAEVSHPFTISRCSAITVLADNLPF